MSNVYVLKRDISHPLGSCKAGTKSIKDETTQGYYVFPYTERTYNQDGNGWMGNGFMIYSPSGELLYEDWFKKDNSDEIEAAKKLLIDNGYSFREYIKDQKWQKEIIISNRDFNWYEKEQKLTEIKEPESIEDKGKSDMKRDTPPIEKQLEEKEVEGYEYKHKFIIPKTEISEPSVEEKAYSKSNVVIGAYQKILKDELKAYVDKQSEKIYSIHDMEECFIQAREYATVNTFLGRMDTIKFKTFQDYINTKNERSATKT